MNPADPRARRIRVERRLDAARDSLPGERNDLPDGTLVTTRPDLPQGDENRDPPANAPLIPP